MPSLACCVACVATAVQAAKQPHLLMIVADDLGYGDLGYMGSEIKTPVLDRLSATGVRLSNYYIQQVRRWRWRWTPVVFCD